MKHRSCWLLSLALLGAPQVTRAQGTGPATPAAPGDARKHEARERFFKGLELAENDDWEAALAQFSRSIELFPTRVALKNAAVSLVQLRRHSEALAGYQRLLAEFGSELDAEEKRSVERSLEELKKKTSEVSIRSEPAGATVIVDGRQRGATPLTLRIDSGTRFVRLFKEGHRPFERELALAGGKGEMLSAKLEPLTRSGRLRVVETSGKKLEVVVDGVAVGTTPWEGTVEAGTRSVILRGPGQLGTPPSTATIFESKLSALSLKASVLDSALRIEPTPSNAALFVDGVPIGAGVWEGRLPNGRHTVEATAAGFLSARRETTLQRGATQSLAIELERDPNDPRWRASVWRAHPYLEASLGAVLAPGFAGDADRACSGSSACDRSLPFGFLVGARAGYQLAGGLGLELFIGYLRAKESLSRPQTLQGEADFAQARSDDFSESITISGPVAALSASYRFFERTPLTARAWIGVARAQARFDNRGTFRGTAAQASTGDTAPYAIDDLSIAEDELALWLPFAGPELRFGHRFSQRFSVDVGAALLVFLGPDRVRTGGRLGRDETRAEFVEQASGTFPDGSAIGTPGRVELPREAALGTFFAVVPSLAARFEF